MFKNHYSIQYEHEKIIDIVCTVPVAVNRILGHSVANGFLKIWNENEKLFHKLERLLHQMIRKDSEFFFQ